MRPATGAPQALAWPLVGRGAELERIARARTGGEGPGVVLSAAAGIGKSRLARDAVDAAGQDGASVSWIHATRSAAAVPLGAFAGLMPADVRSDQPLELMRRSAAALRERAAGRPVVIGVDDAQLLDPTSAALVLHLTVTGAAFVVATVRSAEPCPDAVQSLWKDAGAMRIDLEPLSEAETGTLVEAVLGAAVTERVRRWVYDSSRGNVLYLRELLLGALADGALQERDGLWRLTRRSTPSRSLTELITARMAEIGPAERAAVELLALGEPLRLTELVDLVGTDALAAVELRGLATVQGRAARAEVGLAHPLYGEVVRESMPGSRAYEMRLQLARLVDARPDRSRDDALRIARWLLDAGEPIPVALGVEAAGAANVAGDPELGARLARLARDAGAGAEAALLLARSCAVRKRFDEAESVLAAVEDDLRDQDAAFDYLQQRATVLFWGLSRSDDTLALLARGLDWWPDGSWQRRVRVLQLGFRSLVHGAVSTLGPAEEILADPELEPPARRHLQVVHAENLFFAGRAVEACALARRLRPSVPLRDAHDELALVVCSTVCGEAGDDLAEFAAWMRTTIVEGVRSDDNAAAGIAALALGELGLSSGRYADAGRWLTESIVHFERRDPFGYLPMAHGLLAGVAYFTGDAPAAATAIERYRAALGDRQARDTERPYLVRAEAWGLLAEGDARAAQRLLIETAEQCSGMPFYGIHLRHEALRAGASARVLAPPAAELRERCDARLAAAYADHMVAQAAGDGAALLRVADEFAAIGTHRYAAESAAHAAEVFADAGRQDSARRAAARCRELHALGQDGWAPPIRGVDAAGVELSPREAQLVALAASGLTNAEIADRLVLSVRTVESHIYRAMQKLGVRDRRDL